jgi:hypothetical protein
MKKIQIEVKSVKYVYEAVDGTQFDSEDECRTYDNSAYGVLKGRLANIAILKTTECDLYNGAGSDENKAYVVIPKDEEEVKTIQQLAYLKAYGEEWKKKYSDMVAVGKVLAVTIAYEDDGLWITDLGEMVSSATAGKFKVVAAE